MRRNRGKRSRGVYYGGVIGACLLLLVCLTAAGVFLLAVRARQEEPPPEPAGTDAPIENGSVPELEPELAPDPEPEPDPRQEAVEALLSGMSLEEKVGQMFFVRCPDVGAAEKISQYHLGGCLLFTRDFKDSAGEWLSAEAFMEKTAAFQAAASIPLFLAAETPL